MLIVLGIAEALTIHSSRLVLGLTTTAFFILYGAGLGFVARGLARAADAGAAGRRCSRS